VGALLVPQGQLTGKLRILIDPRLDLRGPVDQPGLGEVIHQGLAIVFAIASAGDPADQVIAVGRRERQDRDEFRGPLARQAHQHEVGIHDLRALIRHPHFRGDAPQILAIVEDVGRIEIRAAGVSLPYSTYNKVGTIDHGDIVDNKRLSQVLRTAQIVQSQRDDRIVCRPSTAHRVDGTPIARNKIAGAKRQRDLSEDDLHDAIKSTYAWPKAGKRSNVLASPKADISKHSVLSNAA
jgi:hypothetical protein